MVVHFARASMYQSNDLSSRQHGLRRMSSDTICTLRKSFAACADVPYVDTMSRSGPVLQPGNWHGSSSKMANDG